MSKPKIDAKQVLEDLRAGFDDTYLMEKYNLSARGLQSLFEKLVAGGLVDRWLLEGGRPQPVVGTSPGEREVSAKEVLKDLRSGMSQDAMMRKYRLSARGLANLFEQLVDAGLIAESELDQGSSLENTVEITEKGFGDVMAKAGDELTKGGEEISEASQPEKREPDQARGPVESELNTKQQQCPACKEPLSGAGDQCPKCGIAKAAFPSEQDRSFGDEPSISMDQTMELVWQCPHCGTRQYKVFDVCPECGLAGVDQAAQGTREESVEQEPLPSANRSLQGSGTDDDEALSDLRPDPDIQVAWLKDGLEAGAAEFTKRPYTKLVRLARALNWIAVLQLVLVISLALSRFLVLKSAGESTAFALPALVIPTLISLIGYGLLRSASEAIKMGIDIAHSLTENNRLLAQILDSTKRGRR